MPTLLLRVLAQSLHRNLQKKSFANYQFQSLVREQKPAYASFLHVHEKPADLGSAYRFEPDTVLTADPSGKQNRSSLLQPEHGSVPKLH